jgi:hypothetical protein
MYRTKPSLLFHAISKNFPKLGGNGNTSPKRREQNENRKEHRSPRPRPIPMQHMPPSRPPPFSLQTTLIT